MFSAALWSRWRLVPQSGHSCHRTDKPLETRTPQPEQAWLVYAGLTACTRFPALSALKVRMAMNALHPASQRLFAHDSSFPLLHPTHSPPATPSFSPHRL